MSDVENAIAAMAQALGGETDSTVESDEGQELESSEPEQEVDEQPEAESQSEETVKKPEIKSKISATALAEAERREQRRAEAELQRRREEALKEKEETLTAKEKRLQKLAEERDFLAILKEFGYSDEDAKDIADTLYVQRMGDAAPAELKEKVKEARHMTKLQKLEAEIASIKQQKEEEAQLIAQNEAVEQYANSLVSTMDSLDAPYVKYYFSKSESDCVDQMLEIANHVLQSTGEVPSESEVVQYLDKLLETNVSKWKDFLGVDKASSKKGPSKTITSSLAGGGPPLDNDSKVDDPVARAVAAMQRANAERGG